MTGEHQVRDAIKPPRARSLPGCVWRGGDEGDESGVGRQHPCCPLKTGRWQPPLGSGDMWVTAVPGSALFSPQTAACIPAVGSASKGQKPKNVDCVTARGGIAALQPRGGVCVPTGDTVPLVSPQRCRPGRASGNGAGSRPGKPHRLPECLPL